LAYKGLIQKLVRRAEQLEAAAAKPPKNT